MKIDIHCKGLSLTDAIKEHVHDKMKKLDRILPGEVEILTILEHSNRQGGTYNAEISFRVWGHDIVAKRESDDMYTAVTDAVENALSQLRRLKEKRTSRRKGGESVRNFIPDTSEE